MQIGSLLVIQLHKQGLALNAAENLASKCVHTKFTQFSPLSISSPRSTGTRGRRDRRRLPRGLLLACFAPGAHLKQERWFWGNLPNSSVGFQRLAKIAAFFQQLVRDEGPQCQNKRAFCLLVCAVGKSSEVLAWWRGRLLRGLSVVSNYVGKQTSDLQRCLLNGTGYASNQPGVR